MNVLRTHYSLVYLEQPGKSKGFTLIELVMTIAILAIVSTISFGFLFYPIAGYSDLVARTQLVYQSEQALRRMERDVRNSLPNSVRVKASGNVQAIEIINVVEAYRYRTYGPGSAAQRLFFSSADTSFNVFGNFPSNMLGSNGYQLVVYNIASYGANTDSPRAGANAYSTSTASGPFPPSGSSVITPPSTTATLSNVGTEGRVILSPGHQFAFTSPAQRVYFIDTPISYVCDPGAGTITRYQGYSIQETQPINEAAAPLASAGSALLTRDVVACDFIYQAGTSSRNGVVSVSFTLSDGENDIRLLQQIAVSNAP